MKNSDVKLGGVYLAKVTDRVVPVRLDTENRHGGWDATNLVTNKTIRIKSAQRLRGPAKGQGEAKGEDGAAPAKKSAEGTKPGEKAKKVKTAAQDAMGGAEATEAAGGPETSQTHATGADTANGGETAQASAKAGTKAREKTDGEARGHGLSCLDAAAQVLKDEGQPLQCKAMINLMHSRGLWTSDAPTPAATLYSAILREIQKKGSEARFKKTERGHFALNA